MYTKEFVLILFTILIIIIIFQWCQIQNNVLLNRNWRLSDRVVVERIAKLVIQSSTNHHPIFALSNIVEARVLLNELLRIHGSIERLEVVLGLPNNKVADLREIMSDQETVINQFIMSKLTETNPELRTNIDDFAGLKQDKDKAESMESGHVDDMD